MTSRELQLYRMLLAAISALRAYQFGNSTPDLAEEVANACEAMTNRFGLEIKS